MSSVAGEFNSAFTESSSGTAKPSSASPERGLVASFTRSLTK
jgi:hypothetical protein